MPTLKDTTLCMQISYAQRNFSTSLSEKDVGARTPFGLLEAELQEAYASHAPTLSSVHIVSSSPPLPRLATG